MLIEQTREARLCTELLVQLGAAFPKRMDPDYFQLCYVERSESLLSHEARERFELLSALISTLLTEGLIDAERFFEKEEYFWDLRLTLLGLRSVKIFEENGDSGRFRTLPDLVQSLCNPDSRLQLAAGSNAA